MDKKYQHLGEYSDWVAEAKKHIKLYPIAYPGTETRKLLKNVLGFSKGLETPLDLRLGKTWVKDGIKGQEVSWSCGYGPRTESWVLKPAHTDKPLPGILALHDHGGFKYLGKEKIAEGPNASDIQRYWWQNAYGGRAYANQLALAGFVVLVHDTFLWGSRRFNLADIPPSIRESGRVLTQNQAATEELPEEIAQYNVITGLHEHTVEKYCNLLGTTLAGVVSHEDRIALNYLLSRDDVIPNKAGCIGLSGGGNRSALLLATSDKIKAAVIVGLMSTYMDLLDHNVVSHTWMFFPNGWSRFGDWPDIAASRAPMPLLVQYDKDDELFTLEGMESADARIKSHYQYARCPDAYTGEFYPGPHKFDLDMQESAFKWLSTQL